MYDKINNPVKNAIMGLIVGDALGVPVEFKDRDALKLQPVTDMLPYGIHQQPAGTWSDDSSLTLCLLEELGNTYNLENIAKSFINWLYNNYWTAHGEVFDVGLTTRKAIEQLKNGVLPNLSGNTEERSNGNGSLMRILPLVFHIHPINNRNERYRYVKEVSAITHAHETACLACFYYLEFACFLYTAEQATLSEAYEFANYSLKEMMRELKISAGESKKFKRLLDGHIMDLKEEAIDTSGYVIHTLEAAIWCLSTTSTYEEAVLKAVNLGDDTDTTAAVTGGLAGLYYGFNSIPEKWTAAIAQKENIEKLIYKFCYKYKIANV